MSHNVSTRLFSRFLVSFASGVVERKLLDETTIKYTETGALTAIQTGCLGALDGSQSLAALNRWGMLVFNEEYYLECFKSYDIYKKI